MIRDYKFDPAFDDRARRRGRGRLFLFAIVLLASVVALLRFTAPEGDTTLEDEIVALAVPQAAPADAEPVTPETVSRPLNLPALPATDSGPAPAAPTTQPQPLTEQPRSEQPPSLLADSVADEPLTAEVEVEAGPIEEKAAKPSQPRPEMRAQWIHHTVASGESLARIFKARSLSANLLHRIVNSSKTAKTLANIRPGQELRFLLDDEDGLVELVLVKSPIESLHVRAVDDTFEAELVSKSVDTRLANVTGTIESSLFVDGQKAGLTDSQIMELAEIFGWDIDFALEIRAGDQFRVIYDEQFVDGEKFRNGPIVAAEFVNRGQTYQAFRYETQDQISYYDADGHSKRRAFIRTPIRFARIASRFTPRRWHPILKRWKSHKGVDYAAPTGTPIKVTGNGKVVFRGWQKGYGRVVIVQHSSKYKTVYAHMSKFRGSVKKGTRVKQGQVIGYVGQSGWATGPHLHYEFRVHNVQRNPLTVKLPKSLPLPKRQLAAYKRKIAPLTQQLASIRQSTMVARADH